MALTSLEAIAEKLQENRQNQLEDILRVSGSTAMVKNDYGITVVEDNNIASSLIFKSLNKPKFDKVEIVKAIDVEIKELKPTIPDTEGKLVQKDTYDAEVQKNKDLSSKVDGLSSEVTTLKDELQTAKNQAEIETNKRLQNEQATDAFANQIDALTKSTQNTSKKIEAALQNSVNESILRASLQSQNVGYKSQIEALIKQVDSLNSIVEGLHSQLGAVQQQQTIVNTIANANSMAAAASTSDIVYDIALIKMNPWGPNREIVASARNDNSNSWFGNTNLGNNTTTRWEYGNWIDITNISTTEGIEIETEINWPRGSINGRFNQEWFRPTKTGKFYVNPGKTERIQFTIHTSDIIFPRNGDSITHYGSYIIKVKRPGTNVAKVVTKEYPTKMQVLHRSKY